MKALKSFLLAAAILLSPIAFGQSATDENEGSRLEADGANGIYRFKWFGKTGRTYFIQHTEDLVSWNWVPVIESGDDSVKEWGFTTSGTKFFTRLRYWTDPTSDPEGDDFDQDGVPNLYEVQHGNSPFGIEDSDLDGLPDGWLDVHANTFAIYPPVRLKASLSRNQTAPGKIYLNNDTDTPVSYAVSVSGNTGPSYSVEDSLTGTAVFQWEDISATGTKLNTISNAWDGYETVSISGFTFPFYGQSYSQVSVGVNGILTFGTPTYDDSPYPIPTYGYGPSNLIAPLWADLETETSGDVYYKEEPNRLIVQYQNVTPAYQTGSHTFQVILYSDGRIEFHYQNAASDSGTVGIGDGTQTRGIELAYYSAYAANSMAVVFLPASNFYTIAPTSGTVSARSRTTLDGLFQSLQLPFGDYTANVSVTHDGGGTSPVNISANLTVRNVPPVVAVVYPTHQETLLEGQSANVTATAVDVDSQIVKVEFYDNGVKIGEDIYAAYQCTWTNLVAGAHTLTAKATDVHGVSVTSAPLSIQVHADSDQDGMADDWESANGLDTTRNDSMEDLDGDRFPNIFEYARGTVPNDAALLPETDFVVDPGSGSASTEDNTYPTIAEALSASNESRWNSQTQQTERPYGWAVIEVKAGVYEEEVYMSGVPVLLLAELGSPQGPAEIRAPSYYGVSFYSASALDGFVISHKPGVEGPGVCSSVWSGSSRRLLTNCIIKGNKATYGGGIYNEGTSVLRLAHCTITGNEATSQGRAIYNLGTIELANSIIWGNSGTASDEIATVGGVAGGASSIIKDGEQGGINENPLVTASGFLLSNSPAINRPGTVLAKTSKVDIHGESRASAPDLGADEYRDENGTNDGDGLPDWAELAGQSGPADDADGDGIGNLAEYEAGWNPRSWDGDDDGLPDIWEWTQFGPGGALGAADPDRDGLSNLQEYQAGSNPHLLDSDNDGLPDGFEAAIGSDPADSDTNDNGMPDGEELARGGNPALSGPPPPPLPPPSTTPPPPPDPAPTPPAFTAPADYDVLLRTRTVSMPKYGFEPFQQTNPAKRYLVKFDQDYHTPTAATPDFPYQSVTLTTTVDAMTGATTPVSSVPGSVPDLQCTWPQSETREMLKLAVAGTSTDQNGFRDSGYFVCLRTENTTGDMVAHGLTKLGAFEGEYEAGAPFAYRNVHENELQFDYQKVEFKFVWHEEVQPEDHHPLTYLVVFKPENDPATEENESETQREIVQTVHWDGENTEQTFTLDPEVLKPEGKDGEYSIVPVEILTPKLDAEGNDTGELKATDNLKVAQWEHAFKPNMPPEVRNDFTNYDINRFYVRVPLLDEDVNIQPRVYLSCYSADGSEIDDETELEMEADVTSPGTQISKSMILVSDDIDDLFRGSMDAGGWEPEDNVLGDRSHKITLNGQICVTIKTDSITEHTYASVPNIHSTGTATKIVYVHAIILKSSAGNDGVAPVTHQQVSDDFKRIRQRYAQINVEVRLVTDAITVDPPPGVNLEDGFDADTEESALIDAYGTASVDDIHLFYVNKIKRIVLDINNVPHEMSISGFTLTESGLNPGSQQYANNAFVALTDPVSVGNEDIISAHELGHILTNAGHFTGGDAAGAVGVGQYVNIMRDGASVSDANCPGTQKAARSKRFYESQKIIIRGNHLAY